MPSSHRVVPASCKRHGARVKQCSARPNIPQHPQPPSWRLAGPAGQCSSYALNLVPSVHTHPQTEQMRQPCDRSHTPKADVPRVESTTGTVVRASGPVSWHGVGRRPWHRVHQPQIAISGSRAPIAHNPAQMAAGRDIVCVWDGRDAEKRKDCGSGDVLRVERARSRFRISRRVHDGIGVRNGEPTRQHLCRALSVCERCGPMKMGCIAGKMAVPGDRPTQSAAGDHCAGVMSARTTCMTI